MAWTEEKAKEYCAQYQKENIRKVLVKINRKTDADILEHLEGQKSMQGYIKKLIREDMKRQKEER